MLSKDKKNRLLQIINEAESNGETPDFIQNQLIPAYKSKHDTVGIDEPQPSPEQYNQRTAQMAGSLPTKPENRHPDPIWDNKTGEVVPENILPYYGQGLKNIKERPAETLFPIASSLNKSGVPIPFTKSIARPGDKKRIPFPTVVKRNLAVPLDVAGWVDRGVDYLSGGAFERGHKTIDEMVPGENIASQTAQGLLKAGLSPSSALTGGVVKKAFAKPTATKIVEQQGKGILKGQKLLETTLKQSGEVPSYIKTGINKGIKPTVKNKSNYTAMAKFEKSADDAIKSIVANKNMKIVDEFGETVPIPRNSVEFAQAIEQTKKTIYDQYHKLAVKAGDDGIMFDAAPLAKKLDDVTGNIKHNPQIRKYAEELKVDLAELHGAAPEVIEARIKDLNSSLGAFYDGRVSKAKAQIDASAAALMRKGLDDIIEGIPGETYQGLKNKYGSLKAIEKEVNHRAIVNARKNTKGLADITDVFTGGDIIAGAITSNPMLIAKGVAGQGIKGMIKHVNDPDNAIKKMFKKAYKEAEVPKSKTKSTQTIGDILGNERGSVGNYDELINKKAKDAAGKQISATDIYDFNSPITHESGKSFDGIVRSKQNDMFDGVFGIEGLKGRALGEGGTHHTYIPRIGKVARAGDIDFDYDKSIKFLKKEFPDANDSNIDDLYELIAEDSEITTKITPEDLYNINNNDEVHYLGKFLPTDLGEASWEAQNLRGKMAISQGYDAVTMADENGASVLIPHGSKAMYVGKNVDNRKKTIGESLGNTGEFSKLTDDIRGSSALKTLAATGAASGAGLTIGEVLSRKFNKKKKKK